MDTFSSAVAVLTAMITPAVLISACGTLILSTSTRLGRVVDRVRLLLDRFEELAHAEETNAVELYEERRKVIFAQLDKLTARARLLQRCMTIFYTALGIFVATSVAIGLMAVADGRRYSWIPVVTGIVGAMCLFWGSILLIFEARLAFATIQMEMDFIWRLGKTLAPPHLVEQHTRSRLRLRRTTK